MLVELQSLVMGLTVTYCSMGKLMPMGACYKAVLFCTDQTEEMLWG